MKLFNAVRRRIRNYLTRDLIHDVFNSALDQFDPNAGPTGYSSFPTWRTLVSYVPDIIVRMPGLQYQFPFSFKYLPYTEFRANHTFIVRAYSHSQIISMDASRKEILLQDWSGNLYFIQNITIPNIVKTATEIEVDSFIGTSTGNMVRVTYFDAVEQTILPITECLVDL
jgi:hypothetical protein